MAEPARDIGFGSRLFRLCVCLGQVEGCYLLCTQGLGMFNNSENCLKFNSLRVYMITKKKKKKMELDALSNF